MGGNANQGNEDPRCRSHESLAVKWERVVEETILCEAPRTMEPRAFPEGKIGSPCRTPRTTKVGKESRPKMTTEMEVTVEVDAWMEARVTEARVVEQGFAVVTS